MDCNGSRHERPEDVDELGRSTTGPEADAEEMPGMYPTPSTLSFRLNALGDFVAVVIEPGYVHVMVVFILLVMIVGGTGYANVLFKRAIGSLFGSFASPSKHVVGVVIPVGGCSRGGREQSSVRPYGDFGRRFQVR